MSYVYHVRPYEKSVVLGSSESSFPVDLSVTNAFARQIQLLVKEAEAAAYAKGVSDCRKQIRLTLGLK